MAIALRNSWGTANSKTQTVSVTAGDLIVVFYESSTGSASPTIADGNSNTYTAGTYTANSGAGCSLDCWFAIASTTNASLAITITDASSNTPTITVIAFSGCNTTLAQVKDQGPTYKASESSASTSHTGASVTTTNANDVLVSYCATQNNGITRTSTASFTKGAELSATNYSTVFYRIVSSTGTYANAWTSSDVVQDAEVILAFKAASAGTYQPYWMMGILD
jgi:hypothetical protein